jgi:hypothetical protein
MKFARLVFFGAGVYGLLVLVPQYFLEGTVGADNPAGLTHPEFFYGFLGVAIAWQIAFLILATDPVRYRMMIVPSIIEKISFAVAAAVLFIQGRVPGMIFGAGMIDLVLAILFIVAWTRIMRPPAT